MLSLPRIWSPELRVRRTVDVYLPGSYDRSSRRYPVIYLQDGQNLSDPRSAFAGTWELPRALDQLAAQGFEAIVVGVHNGGRRRLDEYSPYRDSRHHAGGLGLAYLEFVSRTLKPRVDRLFRTRIEKDATLVGGSSMGGLISLYACFRFPAVFGGALVMSPALWFGNRRIFEYVERARSRPGRLYLDVGTAEGPAALRDARQMRRLLRAKGYDRRTLMYREAEGAPHTEAAWAERLAPALRFVLGGS